MKLATVDVDAFKCSTDDVDSIYLGSEEVWTSSKEPIYWVSGGYFLNNGFPKTLTRSGDTTDTSSKVYVSADPPDNESGTSYAQSGVANVNNYKYITVDYVGRVSYNTTGNGSMSIYSNDGKLLYTTTKTGTYTIEVKGNEGIYFKLMAYAPAYNNYVSEIKTLYFHDGQ